MRQSTTRQFTALATCAVLVFAHWLASRGYPQKLFEAAPGVKPLFSSDMKEQGRKLMQMIGVAVNNMHRIEEIVPALIELGERHDDYGAEPGHYPVVGSVLLDTLSTALGDEFSDEAALAWGRTYDALSSVMLSR